jgi:glutamyl-Q tRNA(Asp) synthetase
MPVDPPPVFRFAPSPNGPLHLGHAFSALLNGDLATATGGRFLVRMEDIDPARCRPEFERRAFDDLAWLGLGWETPVRRQSEHGDAYRAALDRLIAADLVYPAFLSRAEIKALTRDPAWPRDPDGAALYPGPERGWSIARRRDAIASGAPFAWRLDGARALQGVGPLAWTERGAGPAGETGTIAADPAAWGDVVIARKEVPTSYHLAVVVDDALQGITQVVRGRDLFFATAVHRLLQTLLDLPAPTYRHHRLILDLDGHKLSKSDGATGLVELRAAGATPADIRARVGLPKGALRTSADADRLD